MLPANNINNKLSLIQHPVLQKMSHELHKKEQLKSLRSTCHVVQLCKEKKQIVLVNGKKLLNLGGNDYLGVGSRKVSNNILRKQALGGASGKASRLLSGNHPNNDSLEKIITTWKNCEASLVVSSGYAANFGALSALAFSENPPVFLFDRNVHASLIDGAVKNKAKFESFRHNCLNDLEKKITKYKNNLKIVISESIFSMDGDFAPAKELLEITAKNNCLFFFDEAHSHGICGNNGEGVLGHIPMKKKMHLITSGTFGKALGGSGAFLCGSNISINYLINFMRPLIFSTALSPLTLACNEDGLKKIIAKKKPNNKFRSKVKKIKTALQTYGFSIPESNKNIWAPSPILPIIVGSNEKALSLQKKFAAIGYYVPAIRPPTVPQGMARLRLTVNDTLSMPEITKLCNNFAKVF